VERDHTLLHHELVQSGEWVGGNVLATRRAPVCVRVRRRRPRRTADGPFVEVKEHLAGYDLVDCDNLERALEIAARIPRRGSLRVEVRPIMEVGGMEM